MTLPAFSAVNAPITPWLHPNEPVDFVIEENLPPRDYRAPHRYQIYGVIRDDRRHVFIKDMGLSSDWKEEGLILALGGESAAEAEELANDRREDVWLRKFLREQQEASTLNTDLERFFHEKHVAIRNASVFGPLVNIERNAFRMSAVRDKYDTVS